jgi:hypothetical protein
MLEYWSDGVLGFGPITPVLQLYGADFFGTLRKNPWEEIMSEFSVSKAIRMIQQRRVAAVGLLYLFFCYPLHA